MPEFAEAARRDLVRHRVALLLWGPPPVAVLLSGLTDTAPETRGVIWSVALAWAGIACVANACRSGRLHCYLTGPFFLLLAVASLVHSFAVVSLGPHGWTWIGGVFVVGAPLLTIVPERIWGTYGRGSGRTCC